MKIRIAFTFDVTDVIDESQVESAALNLAEIMLVQAEDGLYTLGSPEAEGPDGEQSEPVAALRPIDFAVEVPPVVGDTATITSTTGVRFLARILRPGQAYGATNSLTVGDKPLVEFYDTRFPHTEYGQFVSRYYVETLLETPVGGLNLDGGIADWTVDAAAMDIVRAWLRSEV